MRIVDRKTFLALPPGTLFSKYEPCFMEHLEIKGDSWTNDYIYQGVVEAIVSTGSAHNADQLHEMEHAGLSVPMDFNCTQRDGCFETNQLFAVWERADVEGLVARLQQALVDGYAVP